jgi:hypothetical protein
MKTDWTIEDCLEILTGFSRVSIQETPTLKLEDRGIITSIAKQVYKGTALTDRQCDLVINKLISYKNDFPKEVDIDNVIEKKKLRLPLRSVDRSQWIKKVTHDDTICIAVRFPFNKKTISILRNIERYILGTTTYNEQEKIHYIPYNENNLLQIIDAFKEKKFDIDQDLFDMYNQLDEIRQHRNEHIPALRYNKDNNLVIENCTPELIKSLTDELGEITQDKLVQFVNRMSKYYIIDLDENIKTHIDNTYSPLQKELIFNKKKGSWIDPKKYSLEDIAQSIWLVNRFPILLILENSERAVDDLHIFRQAFKGIVEDKEYSVLFRQDGNSHFNEFVKSSNLNNWFDDSTKVVVIEGKTLPKLLLKSDWYPNFILSMAENVNRTKLQVYFNRFDMLYYYCKKEPLTGIYFD